MLHQATDSVDENCGRLSPSEMLALHDSEIKQLAAVAAQQQRQDALHPSKLAGYGSQGMASVDTYPAHSHHHHHHQHLRQVHHVHHNNPNENSGTHGTMLGRSDPAHPATHVTVPLQQPLESPEYLAHRLLVEFGKTRTNYNSLVPRIVEVMRMFRDYGPMRCPLPVVSNLDELLNDEALIRIEQRYPNSIEAGFLVLCTERRALRSGGGGKYYFIDTSGRLVGCHKSDLPSYAEKGVLRGPVLLKNLIFVFILRGAFGLDPRCKSSNPQRLLEFYENLVKEGKVSDIQRLVRVWSMEIYPETPYDSGFPHCTLLWVKRMHVTTHITKWKHSQWQTSQLRGHDIYARHSLGPTLGHAPALPYLAHGASDTTATDVLYRSEGVSTDDLLSTSTLALTAPCKRRRMTEACGTTTATNPYECWSGSAPASICHPATYGSGSGPIHSENTGNDGQSGSNAETCPTASSTLSNTVYGFLTQQSAISWDIATVQTLYTGFAEFSALLQKGDIMDWSVQLIDRLSPPVLEAAMHLISSTFRPEDGHVNRNQELPVDNDKVLRYDILRILCDVKEKDRMAEGLRILLACLLQQQRLEEFLPATEKPESESRETTSSTADPSIDSDLNSSFPLELFNTHPVKSIGRSASSFVSLQRHYGGTETTTGSLEGDRETTTSSYTAPYGGVSESSSSSSYGGMEVAKTTSNGYTLVTKVMDNGGLPLQDRSSNVENPDGLLEQKSFCSHALGAVSSKLTLSKHEGSPLFQFLTSDEKTTINSTHSSYEDHHDALLHTMGLEHVKTSLSDEVPLNSNMEQGLQSTREKIMRRGMDELRDTEQGLPALQATNDLANRGHDSSATHLEMAVESLFCRSRGQEEDSRETLCGVHVASIESLTSCHRWGSSADRCSRDIPLTGDITHRSATSMNENSVPEHRPCSSQPIKLESAQDDHALASSSWVGVEHWTEGEETVQDDVDDPVFSSCLTEHEHAGDTASSALGLSPLGRSDSTTGTAFLLSVLCAPPPQMS